MWRLMIFISTLQPLYARAGTRFTDEPSLREEEIISRALLRSGQSIEVARHHVALQYSKNRDPNSINETQDLIDDCIASGFLNVHELEGVRDGVFLSISPEGRKFLSFSYFLRFLFSELEVVFRWWYTVFTFILGLLFKDLYQIMIALFSKLF